MKTKIQKTLALLLMLAMVLSVVPFGAFADPTTIDTSDAKRGSITVTKYDTVTVAGGSTSTPGYVGQGTGTIGDNTSLSGNANYQLLNGAKFELYKVGNKTDVIAYYDGTGTGTFNPSDYVDANGIVKADVFTSRTPIATLTTGAAPNTTGVAKFTDLEVGFYILREIAAPEQITAPLSDPRLISIPMVNTATSNNGFGQAQDQWLYDIYVYPKNHVSEGTVNIKKTSNGTLPLEGVTFKLYQKNGSGWVQVTTTTALNGTPTPLNLTTNASGELTITNLPAGLNGTEYLLFEDTAPLGNIVNRNPILFKVNVNNTITVQSQPSGVTFTTSGTTPIGVGENTLTDTILNIAIDNEKPDIDKLVLENTTTNPQWKEWAQYSIGDTIQFKIEVTIPKNISELSKFTISDSLAVLTFNHNVLCQYPSGSGTVTVDYDSNNHGFTIDCVSTANKAFFVGAAGKTVTITYSAVLNETANVEETVSSPAIYGNTNPVTLTYSQAINPDPSYPIIPDNPNDYSITDKAAVFTYQFTVTKHQDTTTGTVMKDVEFRLYADQAGNTEIPVTGTNGVYRPVVGTGTGGVMVTDANGKITIQGLEPGTYYLKETKTAEGYNLLSQLFPIKVMEDAGGNYISETYLSTSDATWGTDPNLVKEPDPAATAFVDANHQADVVNKKGFVLPQTGGMGYLLFCTAGLVLIAGGALLIFGGRKKKIR